MKHIQSVNLKLEVTLPGVEELQGQSLWLSLVSLRCWLGPVQHPVCHSHPVSGGSGLPGSLAPASCSHNCLGTHISALSVSSSNNVSWWAGQCMNLFTPVLQVSGWWCISVFLSGYMYYFECLNILTVAHNRVIYICMQNVWKCNDCVHIITYLLLPRFVSVHSPQQYLWLSCCWRPCPPDCSQGWLEPPSQHLQWGEGDAHSGQCWLLLWLMLHLLI